MAAVSFIPFVALYFLSHPAVSAHDNSNNNIKISCPKSFRCGNSGPQLYFPFSNISNPQCGLCTVFCGNHEHPVSGINFGSEEAFQITDILSTPSGYGSVKVQVYDPELAGDCSGFRNFSLPDSPSISFTIPYNLTTLFRCRKSSRHSPPAHDEYLNYTGCHDFYLYYKKHLPDDHHNVSASADSFHGCDTIFRPLTSTPSKKKTETGENDDDLLKLLNGTFNIELQASEDCLKCHGRGGQCLTISSKFHCTAKNGPNLKLILPLVTVGALAICLIIVLIIRRYKRRKYVSSHLLSRNISADPSAGIEFSGVFFGVPVFKYAELEQATDNFHPSTELGDGGFGTVYHGILQDGREVAVKRLYEHNSRRVMQFLNEVEILTCLRHPNLVSLYGCTSRHSRELLLVYGHSVR